MPDLEDQLRRWADQAEPVTADEARHRAATDVDDRGAGHRPSRRAWLAVAAVAVLLVGIGVGLAVRSGDDPADDVRTVPSSGPTSIPSGPSTTTSSTPSSSSTLPRVNLTPDAFVAHDAEHRLVVVDGETGRTVRVLATFDDPDAVVPEGEPAGMGRYLGRFAVAPDRSAVYYETCCEPAVGEIFRVPIEGGDPQPVTTGTDPAISPDGTKLAVIQLQALKVVDLRTGDETIYPIADNSPVVALAHPSWSPDGTMVALERYDESVDRGRAMVVTFDGAQDVLNAAATVAEADDAGTPMFPTFDDGGILLVRQRSVDGTPTGEAHMERYALYGDRTPTEVGVTYPQPVVALDRSAGGHLVRLLADGTVELDVTDGGIGNVITDLRLRDVAW